MRQLFPGTDLGTPCYPDMQSLDEKVALLEAVAAWPSVRIDAASYECFQRLGKGKFDPQTEDELALACLDRLLHKGHDAEFEKYLARRISQPVRPARLSPATKQALAALRHETYAVTLEGDAVTEANLQSLPGHGLHVLTLRGPRVTDARLAVLAKLPTLESLNLDSDGMTDGGLARLEKLTHLETLWLHSAGSAMPA